MMKCKKFISALLLGTVSIGIFSGCGAFNEVATINEDDGTITLSVAYNDQTESVTGLLASDFAQRLETLSGGKMTVNVYPSGQLGSDKELIQSCVSGDIEFVVQNHAAQVNNVPEAGVLDMPFLFQTIDQARAAIDDPTFRESFDKAYENKNLKLLLVSDNGFRVMTSNKKIEKLEDFKGLDIRTMENPVHLAIWQALGANPTPMNRSEVFLALQQGLLQAQEDPNTNNLLNAYNEVQKYAIQTNHLFHDVTVITNLEFYNTLPEEYRAWIDQASDEALAESRMVSNTKNNEQDLIDAGMEVVHLSDEVYDQIVSVEEKNVWPLIRQNVGDDLVDKLLAAREHAMEQ